MYAAEEILLVRPASTYHFVIMTCPSGPYFTGTVDLLAEPQVRPRVPGRHRRRQGGRQLRRESAGRAGSAEAGVPHGPLARFAGAPLHRRVRSHEHRVRHGRPVVTPPLSGTILPGITRDSVLTLCRDAGVPVEERRISIDEIFERQAAGKTTQAAGVGTAATVAPIRQDQISRTARSRWRRTTRIRRSIARAGSSKPSARANAADTHNWLTLYLRSTHALLRPDLRHRRQLRRSPDAVPPGASAHWRRPPQHAASW